MEDLTKYVLGVAAKSNVQQRKVGCIIIDDRNKIVAEGYNEDDGTHAEVAACRNMCEEALDLNKDYYALVTHPPCPECAKQLNEYVKGVKVVTPFMKFDGDKVRYDLIPPKPMEYLAEVLTFGARKYKPNNWRECTDLSRYEGALLRHIQAYRMGEKLDPETGLPHLAHAMCNLTFLLELDHDNN